MENIVAELKKCVNLLTTVANKINKLEEERLSSIIESAYKDGYGTALENMKTTLENIVVTGPIDDHVEHDVIGDHHEKEKVWQAFISGRISQVDLELLVDEIPQLYPDELKDCHAPFHGLKNQISLTKDKMLVAYDSDECRETYLNVRWIYNPTTDYDKLNTFVGKLRERIAEIGYDRGVNVEIARII